MRKIIQKTVKNIRNKLVELWKRMIKPSESFGTKMYLGNLFVVLIGIGIVFVSFTAYNVTTLYENTQRDMQMKAENTLRGIEARINMLNTISVQLSSSPVIIDAMKEADDNEGNDFIYDVQTSHEIYEYLWSYIIDRDSANSITIYNNSGDYIYTGEGMTFSSTENFAVETELLLEYVDGIETLFAKKEVHKVLLNKGSNHENGHYQGDAIALVRPIRGSLALGARTIAYAEIGLEVSDIEAILNNSAGEGERYILYADNPRMEICSSETLEGDESAYTVEVSMEEFEYSLVLCKSSNQEMYLVRSTVITFVILYLFLIICLALVQKKVTAGIMKPLVALCSSVSNIEEWKEQKNLSDTKKNETREVNELTEAFNELISKLEHSINENVMARTGEATAHLFALQSQMNPHFIHNTLAIIQAYAGEENYEVVDEICDRLSGMIRYSSDYRNHRATLASEVEHATNYLQLMKLRYESDFEFTIKNKMQLSKIMVPCFIIQPIIENSVTHGLVKKPYPWNIAVEIVEDEEFWHIVIQDNGNGVEEQHVQEILSYVEGVKSGKIDILNEKHTVGGLSIKNVICRLYLEYGTDMKFQIENHENGGARVVIGGRI